MSATSCGRSCSRWFSRCAPLLADMMQPKRIAEIQLTWIDGGADLLIKGVCGPVSEIEQLTSFAIDHGLARLSVDRGLGPETI